MKITFHGAAGEVTGSCYLVETDTSRFVVDCGMFQGGKGADTKNRKPFAFNPSSLDFVLLTHAHIDHSGLLPKLCQDGFSGPIHTSEATAELLDIMLRDSAHIHEMDAERANRRRRGKHHGELTRKRVSPLYTMADAEHALERVSPQPYFTEFKPSEDVRVMLRDAGHILGSAILEIWVKNEGVEKKLVFSGDLGQPNRPIIRDPEIIEEADYLVVESTYGDRDHKELEPSLNDLLEITRETLYEKQGNLIIPAFALGRSQELIYYFQHLTCLGKLKNLTIFLDSPMAQNVTRLTMQHLDLFDQEARKLQKWYASGKSSVMLNFTDSVSESQAINTISSGAIILSASGMCTAGRILHHLRNGLSKPNNTILFAGYQANGTLGRKLIEGAKRVRIFGDDISVRAAIRSISGFSAHADRTALLNWIDGFTSPPRHTFVTHGEPEAAQAMKDGVIERFGNTVTIPVPGQTVDLSS
jgi:metallo-beta-lactamase family protein